MNSRSGGRGEGEGGRGGLCPQETHQSTGGRSNGVLTPRDQACSPDQHSRPGPWGAWGRGPASHFFTLTYPLWEYFCDNLLHLNRHLLSFPFLKRKQLIVIYNWKHRFTSFIRHYLKVIFFCPTSLESKRDRSPYERKIIALTKKNIASSR